LRIAEQIRKVIFEGSRVEEAQAIAP